MPKIIWQRYHVLHAGSQAHTLAKNLGYPRQPKPATKRGNLKGHPPRSATREKKGQTDGALGIALPSVTSSYLLGQLYALPLSLSLPTLRRFVPPLICGRCKFGQSSVQSNSVVSLRFSICCPNWFVVHTCCASTSGRRPFLAVFC